MESVGQGFRWGTAERTCLQCLGARRGDNAAEASPRTWLVWTLLWTGPLLGPSAGSPAAFLSSGPGLLHRVVASDRVDFLHRSLGLGEEGVPTHWWKPPQKSRLVTFAPFCQLQENHKSAWIPEEGNYTLPFDGGGMGL